MTTSDGAETKHQWPGCGVKGLDAPMPQRWQVVREQLVDCSDQSGQGDVKQLRRHKPTPMTQDGHSPQQNERRSQRRWLPQLVKVCAGWVPTHSFGLTTISWEAKFALAAKTCLLLPTHTQPSALYF